MYSPKIKQIITSIVILLLFATTHLYAQSTITAQKSNIGYTTWREQVAYMQDLAKTSNADIIFKSYKYAGKIRSERHKIRILNRILSNDAPMIFTIVHVPPKSSKQLIVPCSFIDKIMKSLSNEDKDAIAEHRQYINSLIDDFHNKEIIYLKWSYRGNIYRSIAIADDNRGGILYDNIAIYATAYKERKTMDIPLIIRNHPHK